MNPFFKTIIVLALIISSGCEVDHLSPCSGESDRFKYYDAEILDEDATDLYGKWELYEVDGGFSGIGHEIPSNSFLELIEHGKYKFLEGNDMISCGRLVIIDTDLSKLLIQFENSGDAIPTELPYTPQFISRDSLRLVGHCSDCFNYSYARVD